MSCRLSAVALAAIGVLAFVPAAGIGAPGSDVRDPVGRLAAAAPVAATATLAGHVRLCGGPEPGGCWVQSIRYCRSGEGCLTSRQVAVIDVNGQRVALAKLHHARFRVKLVPGRYTVQLLGDGPHVHDRVMQTRNVFVAAGQTTEGDFLFAIP
jgi:hypothetical protein